MSDLPDDLDLFVDAIIDQLSNELSDAVIDNIIDDLQDELPPKLEQELRGGQLEPISPSDGIDRFWEQSKQADVGANSVSQYKTKLAYIEEFLTQVVEIENLNNLSPRQAEEYEGWRKYDSLDREKPLAGPTLEDDMYLYKEFLEYMTRIRGVPADTYEIVEVPNTGEGVDKETLDADRADVILVYLDCFEYASREHVTILLLMKTGRRPCDLRALDVDDFDDSGDEATLTFKHRPDEGTGLKENEKHEAGIDLTTDVTKVIRDYIKHDRDDVEDAFGREPLLSTKNGRLSKSSIREYAYKWTRPCKVGKDCPHDRDPDDCEAANSSKKASGCPDSRSPRKIRSGYVTAKLNAGSSYESVGHRVGATKGVLQRHYDHPNQEEERERYQEDIQENNEDAGGYTNEPSSSD